MTPDHPLPSSNHQLQVASVSECKKIRLAPKLKKQQALATHIISTKQHILYARKIIIKTRINHKDNIDNISDPTFPRARAPKYKRERV